MRKEAATEGEAAISKGVGNGRDNSEGAIDRAGLSEQERCDRLAFYVRN